MFRAPVCFWIAVRGFASKWCSDLLRDEAGQDIVEYALIAVLIALGTVASTRTLAASIISTFARVGTTLSGAV